jgi:hypothetical protein
MGRIIVTHWLEDELLGLVDSLVREPEAIDALFEARDRFVEAFDAPA